MLKLDHNHLSNLPDDIGLLENLEELDLSYNKLSTLPSSIGSLRSLVQFSAGHNILHTLPESFSFMPGNYKHPILLFLLNLHIVEMYIDY